MNEKDKLLQEVLNAYKKANYNGIVLIPTGSGKGRMMIEIAKLLNPKNILYLCNTTLLRDATFIDELHKWDAAYLLENMDLCCYQTACKWVGKEYQLLLADEFDAALTPAYIKAITNNKFEHKILVSATLQDAKKRLAKQIAPIIYELTLNEAISTDVLNNINFYYVNYNLSKEENLAYLSFNTRFKNLLNTVRTKSVESQLKWLQIQRKQFLNGLNTSVNVTKWLLQNLRKTNEKVLVFCGLSAQADKVCEYTYHNSNNNIEAFFDFEKGIIKQLAVCDKLDRGINIPDIRHIIHESIGSNKTRLTQRIGRGLRLKPNEYVNVYLLLPHYIDNWGHLKPTIVKQWITDSSEDMDLTKIKQINYP